MTLVLITGGSSGIGLALAEECARDGYSLILMGRNKERLARAAHGLTGRYGVSVKTIALDLSVAGGVNELVARLKREGNIPEILINNAGFGESKEFTECDWDWIHRMLGLQVTAFTQLTHLLLPEMLKCGRGKILNVASVVGFHGAPRMAVYAATKAYMISLSDALRTELSGTGVTVTTLAPGLTRTRFFDPSRLERRFWTAWTMMTAESVAKVGYRAMKRGKRLAVSGLLNRMYLFLIWLIPGELLIRLYASGRKRFFHPSQ